MSTTNYFRTIASWFASWLPNPQEQNRPAGVVYWDANREEGYRYREAFYDNTIYLRGNRASVTSPGFVDSILKNDLGVMECDKAFRLNGYYNPIKEIVEAYAGIFPGNWGDTDGVRVADKVDGKDVNPKLVQSDALGQLWRWSNLDTEKQKLLEWGPNLGTVGLRVYGKDDPDPKKRRVYIGIDHPRTIVDFVEDRLGNVEWVKLADRIPDPNRKPDDATHRYVSVIEEMTATTISRKIDGVEQLTGEQLENKSGFCPYVILRHLDRGRPFGAWAYLGTEPMIHGVNYLLSLLPESLRRVVFANWFVTAGGPPPTNMPLLDGTKVAYVQSMPDTPPPSMEALVAKIDYPGIMQVIERNLRNIRNRQPETNFYNIEVIPTVSGEALQQFRAPTEKRIGDARPNYHHAMRRAMQMGVSYMVGMKLVDLGAGMGTTEAIDKSFNGGLMDFAFADAPLLPLTTFQKLQNLQLAQAPMDAKLSTARAAKGVVSDKHILTSIMGHSEADAQKILDEKSKQDVTTDNQL